MARPIWVRARAEAMKPAISPPRNPTWPPFTPAVTVFLCANAVRGGRSPASAASACPSAPTFNWPFAVKEVLVPCTGRIQPEHLLKAFETGADAVCVITCDEANCHHVDGSRRARRRVEYVGRMLEDIGPGAQRVMLLHLPGSAREDMAIGLGEAAPPGEGPSAAQIQALVDEVVMRVMRLPPNLMPVPRESPPPPEATYEIEQPQEESDE